MSTIQFKANIKDGVIEIPEEYRQELIEEDVVTVTIYTVRKPKKKISEIGFIAELTKNPIQVKDFKFLTREEAHERKWEQ